MAVNNDAIVQAVSGLRLVGNEDGLIPAFGLYLTRHYASYYNRISFASLHAAEERGEMEARAMRAGLVDAGHQCAFFTFGGIMMSQEWDAVVKPMIETREDWVRGIIGVVNALGWGVWKVENLQGGKELKVSIGNSYESTGYLEDYGKRASGGVCFLATGGVAGIMNLIYHGDVTTRPALDDGYYKRLFADAGSFTGTEVACRAHGAERCEIVARRG
ncbi:MAG: hypothetical protein AB2A00_17605 [Myxococcota bacterium]